MARWVRRVPIGTAIAMAALVFPAAAQAGHWCSSGDPAVYASNVTSCPFAKRIVSKYAQATAIDGRYYGAASGTLRVWSPVTHRRYRVRFYSRGGYVRVRGPHGIRARFSSDFG